MAKKRNLGVYLTAFALFVAGLGYLVYTGLDSGSVYFLNVGEARAATADKLANARLFGTVAEEELVHDGDSLRFQLQDKDNPAETIPVVFKGALPDAFKPGAEVIVEGALAPGGYFSAKTLMTKCPSKYRKENRKI